MINARYEKTRIPLFQMQAILIVKDKKNSINELDASFSFWFSSSEGQKALGYGVKDFFYNQWKS